MKNLSGVEAIARERIEQIEKHGRTVEWDVEQNDQGQLSWAANALLRDNPLQSYPIAPVDWNHAIWIKMCEKPLCDRLIIAGALIAAEIDRLKHILETIQSEIQ